MYNLSLTSVVAVLLFGSSAACGKGDKNAPANVQGKTSPTSAGKTPDKADPGSGKVLVPKAPSRGPEHAVYSLVDNRLSAHLIRDGGLLLPAGSAGFVKYIRFRKDKLSWKIKGERDGAKVATVDGRTGRVVVPLTAEQASGGVTLHLRAFNDDARRMSVRVNGKQKQEATAELVAGWATIGVSLPEGVLHEGENELLFFMGKGSPMTVEWMQLGGAVAAEGSKPTAFYDSAKKSLLLPAKGGLAYYIMGPAKGSVTADLADPACKVEVRALAEDGGKVTGTLSGRGSAVDISALAGKAARLELIATGCPVAELSNAALVVPGAAPTYTRDAKIKPKYVAFWIMDSLRADRVMPFVAKARPEVPTFQRMAKNSSFFGHCYVQGNESKSSHASIWASLYPSNHKFFTDSNKLAAKWTTIDEVAKAAGLYASGVSANGYIIKRRGFGTAWDAYRNHIHEGGGLTGADVLAKGIASVDGKTDPWFLYLGSIDTHVSWRVKEPWMSRYDPGPYKGRFTKAATGAEIGAIATGKVKISERDIERVRAIYDSNVSYQDDLLDQFMNKLEEWGIADQTMVIVTGDHGDEQWEVGRVGHGGSVRESLVWVPLVIHYPPLFPGKMIDGGVEVIDIVPTIADVMGVEADPEWQGESLLALANGVGGGYERMIMASQYENAHAVRMGGWKLRVAGAAKPRLFNLAAEPGEKTDLVDSAPIPRRLLADGLWLLRANNEDWKKTRWGNPANVSAHFAADLGE